MPVSARWTWNRDSTPQQYKYIKRVVCSQACGSDNCCRQRLRRTPSGILNRPWQNQIFVGALECKVENSNSAAELRWRKKNKNKDGRIFVLWLYFCLSSQKEATAVGWGRQRSVWCLTCKQRPTKVVSASRLSEPIFSLEATIAKLCFIHICVEWFFCVSLFIAVHCTGICGWYE